MQYIISSIQEYINSKYAIMGSNFYFRVKFISNIPIPILEVIIDYFLFFIGPFPWLILFIHFTLLCSNSDAPTQTRVWDWPSPFHSAIWLRGSPARFRPNFCYQSPNRNFRAPRHYSICSFFGLGGSIWFCWAGLSACLPHPIWFSPKFNYNHHGII